MYLEIRTSNNTRLRLLQEINVKTCLPKSFIDANNLWNAHWCCTQPHVAHNALWFYMGNWKLKSIVLEACAITQYTGIGQNQHILWRDITVFFLDLPVHQVGSLNKCNTCSNIEIIIMMTFDDFHTALRLPQSRKHQRGLVDIRFTYLYMWNISILKTRE